MTNYEHFVSKWRTSRNRDISHPGLVSVWVRQQEEEGVGRKPGSVEGYHSSGNAVADTL